MSDSEDIDLDGGDESDGGGSPKKRGGGGLGNLLPNILKFVAIGLGALIFIITICVVTFNIMNNRGASQTVVTDPLSPYAGRRPEFSWYEGIGQITTQTSDVSPKYTVNVQLAIGYDKEDQMAHTELSNRRIEMQDFARNFFSRKRASDLTPDNEEALKVEIREQLNTRFLDTARARIIVFTRLDVMEVF